MMSPKKQIIFDMDGVLIDSSIANIKAFQYAFKKAGLKVPTSCEIRRLIGRPPLVMMEFLGCPKSLSSILFKEHLTPYYLDRGINYVRPYKNVYTVLNTFKRDKVPMTVCTSGTNPTQKIILKKLDLYNFFDILHTKSDSQYRKPNPKFLKGGIISNTIDTIFYIDDTEEGIAMGNDLNIVSIFASYGFGSCNSTTPMYIIDDIIELIDIITVRV